MANDTDLISSHNHNMEYHDDWDPFGYDRVLTEPVFYLIQIVAPIVIFGGLSSNVLALVVLVRSRLWLKHEGYVYLAAIFCANVGVLLFCSNSSWLLSISRYYYPPNTSEFLCRFWHFMISIFYAPGWLSVALLFNVYLREHLIHRRRCGCPMFAAKYCTLFASKVIVGVIFGIVTVFALSFLGLVKIDPHIGCVPTEGYNQLAIAELCTMWGLPLVIFLVVIVIVLCTSREGSAFGFSQIEERSEFQMPVRAVATTLSSMIFLSQVVLFVPFHVVSFSANYLGIVEVAYGVTIVLQPVLCFIILTTLREGFRSQLRSVRCCRPLFPSLDRDEEVVQLSAVQEDPPSTTES